jgi:hypothetical protein
MTIVWSASQGSSSSAIGTRVVLPAPGAASSTTSLRADKASLKAGKTDSIGNKLMMVPS